MDHRNDLSSYVNVYRLARSPLWLWYFEFQQNYSPKRDDHTLDMHWEMQKKLRGYINEEDLERAKEICMPLPIPRKNLDNKKEESDLEQKRNVHTPSDWVMAVFAQLEEQGILTCGPKTKSDDGPARLCEFFVLLSAECILASFDIYEQNTVTTVKKASTH